VDRVVDRPQHPVEFMPAPKDQSSRRHDAVSTLPLRQPGIFFDAIDGDFGSPAEDRKHRAVLQEVDSVIPPFAFGDLASVKTKNAAKLAPVEGHLSGHGLSRGALGGDALDDLGGSREPCPTRTLAARKLTGFDFARTCCHGRLLFFMVLS
jgi:hypothetical protein